MSTHNLVELEVFFTDIEPELPECPAPVIENRIRDAIIDSCERAHLWREELPEVQVTTDEREYVLRTPNESTLVHSILSATINDASLQAIDEARSYSQRSLPAMHYMVPDRGLIYLTSAPLENSDELGENAPAVRTTYGLQVAASIKPTRKALTVSEVLHDDHYWLVVHGALAKAMMMDKRAWTNMELGTAHEAKYELALAKARQGIDRGFRTSSQKITPRRFA